MPIILSLLLLSLHSLAEPKLSAADRLGIPYEVVSRDCGQMLNPSDRQALQFHFQNLSQVQFDLLKEAYGNQSQVSYKADQDYELSDFLSPKIQALVGKRFKTIEEDGVPWVKANFSDLDDTTIRTETNCYSTLWELLRPAADHISLFWAEQSSVRSQLQDPKFSNQIGHDHIKPGDFVLFVDEREDGYQTLLHAAYFVDGNVFFEKTDTGSPYVYRFVTLDDMQNKLKNLAETQLKTLFYSPKSKAPPASQTFSVEADSVYAHLADLIPSEERASIVIGSEPGFGGRPIPGLYRIRDCGISIDGSGRGILKPGDPLTRRFSPAY